MIFLQKSTFSTLQSWRVSKAFIRSEAGPIGKGTEWARVWSMKGFSEIFWKWKLQTINLQMDLQAVKSEHQPGRSVLRVRCNYLYFDITHSATPNSQRRNCWGFVRTDASFVNDNSEFVLRHRWTTLWTTWMLFPFEDDSIPAYIICDKALPKRPWIFFCFHWHLWRFGEKKKGTKCFWKGWRLVGGMKVSQGIFCVQFACSSTAKMMYLGERKPGKLEGLCFLHLASRPEGSRTPSDPKRVR